MAEITELAKVTRPARFKTCQFPTCQFPLDFINAKAKIWLLDSTNENWGTKISINPVSVSEPQNKFQSLHFRPWNILRREELGFLVLILNPAAKQKASKVCLTSNA